jgi:hypothetical protein
MRQSLKSQLLFAERGDKFNFLERKHTVKTTWEDCAGFRVAWSLKRPGYGLEDRETYQNIRCHKSKDKNLKRNKFVTLKRVNNDENLIFRKRFSQE